MRRNLFILLLWPLFATAQHPVAGYVYDARTGKPLKDIGVYLLAGEDREEDISITDSCGRFRLDVNLQQGEKCYQLLVQETIYRVHLCAIQVPAKNEYAIYLFPESSLLPDRPGMVSTGNHWCTMYGDYAPLEIRNWQDIPSAYREKIQHWLVKRVGDSFFNRIQVTGGEWVNLDRLQAVENYKRRYRWKPQTCLVHLSFSDTARGLARYTTSIQLDENRKITLQPEWPAIAAAPEKANLIPLTEAIRIATDMRCYQPLYAPDLEYNDTADCFAWSFYRHVCDSVAWTDTVTRLQLAAHSGKVLSLQTYPGCLSEPVNRIMLGSLDLFILRNRKSPPH